MIYRVLCLCCVVGILSPTAQPAAGQTVTGESLLREMVNTFRLGQYPVPTFSTVQFSSYDRRSSVPGGKDWFANSDGFGREPVPNFEAVLQEPNAQGIGRYLICDVKGPGAIVRTWTAAIEGSIRVVLDDAGEAIFEGQASEFLQSGLKRLAEQAGVSEAEYVGTYRQRDACYFPVPFSKRCRIEWTGNHQRIHFYEVQIRRYEPNTEVAGLTKKDMKTLAPTVREVARILAGPSRHWEYRSDKDAVAVNATVAPGKTVEVLALEGPQAVERLSLKVAGDDLDRALRQTILHINFDDHASDQVQCPIGDFFGSAPGVNPYDQVPFSVEPNGTMTCRFVMPFRESCKIRLLNRGDQEVSVTGDVLPAAWQWDEDRSMHFRARWRVDHDLVADSGAAAQDLPFLLARGAGVYVGTAIMLLNPNPIPTPYGNWWGEGDEKIFVDGDIRPSTFGTGSEDYFNYSWSSPDIFLYPYCGQPRNDGPANRGFVVNQRWHIMDAIPFHQRIAFYMELYSHERTENFSYARIGYHYGRPGLVDDFVGLTGEDVRPLTLPEGWLPEARFGARNGVFYQADELVRTQVNTSLKKSPLWAGGRLLKWSPTARSEELVFELPVEAAGKYALHVTAAKTPESGRLVATLNGKSLAFATEDGSVDLRTDHRILLRNFTARDVELKEGKHRLAFRISSAEAKNAPTGRMPTFGIDFIWLQK